MAGRKMKQYTERVLQAIFLIALFATIYVAGGEQYNTPGGHENTRETLLLCQNDQHEAIDMMIEANERFTIPPSTWSMSGQLARNNGGVRSVGSYGDSPEQEACDNSFNIRIKSANSACMHHLSPSKVKTMHLYSLGRIVI